ncbi:MAG TPA: hypothetical protein VI612_04620 [Candidatus Nanoarchaeia archaeon]|nr:hypothetical protein [Candidatus Nanoarchaeia archaeon]
MKPIVIALIFLISCAPAVQEVFTKPTSQEVKEVPVEAVIEPVKEEVKTEVDVQPTEPVQQLRPEEQCVENCQTNCERSAQNACTQKERSGCKDICNDNPIIDPSACTQACTYLSQSNVCKQQMEQFCSAQCVGTCH